MLRSGPRKGELCNRACMPHNHERCSQHDPTGRLVLTAAWADSIRRGGAPHIRGTGDPPIVIGHIRYLGPNLHIRVTRVHTDKDGWWIKYVINDMRHKYMNLRRTPADDVDLDAVREAFAPENFEWDQLPVVGGKGEEAVRIDSAYTSRKTGLVDNAGEGVSIKHLEAYSKNAGKQHRLNLEQRRERLTRRIKEVTKAAERKGVLTDDRLTRLEEELADLERETRAA